MEPICWYLQTKCGFWAKITDFFGLVLFWFNFVAVWFCVLKIVWQPCYRSLPKMFRRLNYRYLRSVSCFQHGSLRTARPVFYNTTFAMLNNNFACSKYRFYYAMHVPPIIKRITVPVQFTTGSARKVEGRHRQGGHGPKILKFWPLKRPKILVEPP